MNYVVRWPKMTVGIGSYHYACITLLCAGVEWEGKITFCSFNSNPTKVQDLPEPKRLKRQGSVHTLFWTEKHQSERFDGLGKSLSRCRGSCTNFVKMCIKRTGLYDLSLYWVNRYFHHYLFWSKTSELITNINWWINIFLFLHGLPNFDAWISWWWLKCFCTEWLLIDILGLTAVWISPHWH